jgi:hypothetical protein
MGNPAPINTRTTLMNSIDSQTIVAREVTECERMRSTPSDNGMQRTTMGARRHAGHPRPPERQGV